MLDTSSTEPRALIRSMLAAGRDLENIAAQFHDGQVVDSLLILGTKAIRVGDTTFELPIAHTD